MGSCSFSRASEAAEVRWSGSSCNDRAVTEPSRSFTGDVCAGEGTPVGNIVQILLGLAKSYFNIKGKTNTSIQVRAGLGHWDKVTR